LAKLKKLIIGATVKKWGIDPFTLGAYAMFTKNQVIDNGKWHGY
jgi:hypothetical protein